MTTAEACHPVFAFQVGAWTTVIFGAVLLLGAGIAGRLRGVPARPQAVPLMIEEEAMQLTFEDAEAAIEAKEAMLADALERNAEWNVLAIAKFHQLKHKLPPEFIGEDIRDLLVKAGIPHRPQAWGPLINVLLRGKQIEKTGAYRKMQAAGSNARESRCYKLAAQRELEPA